MFPKLSQLRELEFDTLKRVCQIAEFSRLSDLRTAACRAFSQINPHRGPVNVYLDFQLEVRMRARNKRSEFRRRVGVGAVVQPGNGKDSIRNASYSLIICRNERASDSPILRKFHIDYEPIAFRNPNEPKPSVHMQWCGTLSAQQLSEGYSETRLQALYPDFEKPRLPAAPTSIALMLNWLLLEFQYDPAAQPVLRNSQWRALVATAERTVLVPYYRDSAQFLSARANDGKRFLQNYQYEMICD